MSNGNYVIQVTGGRIKLSPDMSGLWEPATDEGTVPTISSLERGKAEKATRHAVFPGSGHLWRTGEKGRGCVGGVRWFGFYSIYAVIAV